ncbi:hypothetical protein XNC3_1900001 [Xenorhabdus nematophila F1]|nr:hypothetical protein XNC3_1900001 [Xenorhabdus nematophila F1]
MNAKRNLDDSRFIPVLTGNTNRKKQRDGSVSVYPRTYGEHEFWELLIACLCGLSPYLRGTPVRVIYTM